MRFTLTYDGPLTPDARAPHKMEIRQQIHRQLAELWAHAPLNNFDKETAPGGALHQEVRGFGFTSVVHDVYKLRADLDILLLREAAPGSILSRADIDNQLKTLFDALTVPQKLDQVPPGWEPGVDEQPMHCLLDDDRRITRLRLETERWLDAPAPQHVRAFIRVRITHSSPTHASVMLGA